MKRPFWGFTEPFTNTLGCVTILISYLKASGYQVGLLLNFGAKKLQIKPLAN